MSDIITIRQCRQEDLTELLANAKEDNHAGVYLPTHVSIKDNEIVGYMSLGQFSPVLTWQHTKKVKPLDSIRLLSFMEGALSGGRAICIPCDPDSPYNRLLPKAGYVEYTKPVKLYIKGA